MKIKKYLEQSPIFALNATYEAVVPKLNKKLAKENVNLLQGLVLTGLFFEERSDISPSQLAEIFHTSRGNMSHLLSGLEYLGYIKRVVNELDARQFRIELKPEGKKKALALIKFYDKIQDIFEKEMGTTVSQKTVEGILKLGNAFRNSNI